MESYFQVNKCVPQEFVAYSVVMVLGGVRIVL